MLVNSVLNEGVAGMQQSQKKMLQAAQDIVRAGQPQDRSELNPNPTGATPLTDAGAAVPDLPAVGAVEANSSLQEDSAGYGSQYGDVAEPLIEQRRQQLLFSASANVVQVANDTLGTLIDDLS